MIVFPTEFSGFQLGSQLQQQPKEAARVLSTLSRLSSPTSLVTTAYEIRDLGYPHQTAQFLRDLADQIDATPSNDNQLKIPA